MTRRSPPAACWGLTCALPGLLPGVMPCAAQTIPTTLPTLNIPRATVKPGLDARETDDAWNAAAWISHLDLSLGSDARDRPLPTAVRLMWDEEFLYVRFWCRGDSIYTPFAGPERDQPLYQGDAVEVFLDVVGDGRQVVEIQLSPRNQIFDQQLLLTTDARSDEYGKLREDVLSRDFWAEPAWNCEGLRTATRRTGDGWIGELALPAAPLLRRLGQKTWAPQTVRMHLMRYAWTPDATQKSAAQRRLIAHTWGPVKHGCPHISPAAMGFLRLRDATH